MVSLRGRSAQTSVVRTLSRGPKRSSRPFGAVIRTPCASRGAYLLTRGGHPDAWVDPQCAAHRLPPAAHPRALRNQAPVRATLAARARYSRFRHDLHTRLCGAVRLQISAAGCGPSRVVCPNDQHVIRHGLHCRALMWLVAVGRCRRLLVAAGWDEDGEGRWSWACEA